MLKVVENTKWWFAGSLTVITIAIVIMFMRGGLNLGVDFSGGTTITIDMKKDFDKSAADDIVKKYVKGEIESKKANDNKEFDFKTKADALKDEDVTTLVKDLQAKFGNEVNLINKRSVGPTVGAGLKQKAITSLVIALFLMLIYIGVRFEFKFGIASILALVHDVLITLSVYVIFNIPISMSFIAAILTIIGYSMNDTVVIFDRIRENSKLMKKVTLTELVNKSINQTLTRSIYTVVTVLIMIISVYILVPIPSIREFALPLIVGIASGCFSSIFIASPFWVIFKNSEKRRRAKA